MEKFPVIEIHHGTREQIEDSITEEVPLTIEVNGKEIATQLCSPLDLEDLVCGFLFTSGLISGPDAIRHVTIDRERWKANVDIETEGLPEEVAFKRVYASGCGKGVVFHNPMDLIQRVAIPAGFQVEAGFIMGMMKTFLSASDEHRITHGVHSAAIADKSGIRLFRDDIGRHNALDKVIGAGLNRHLDFGSSMLLSSGRISSEILSKVMRCRVPIVVSAGVPTNQAIRLAGQINLTIAGSARSNRLKVYSGTERII